MLAFGGSADLGEKLITKENKGNLVDAGNLTQNEETELYRIWKSHSLTLHKRGGEPVQSKCNKSINIKIQANW